MSNPSGYISSAYSASATIAAFPKGNSTATSTTAKYGALDNLSYTVTSNGCSATSYAYLNFLPLSDTGIVSGASAVCTNATTTFTSNSSTAGLGTFGSITFTGSWSSGNTSIFTVDANTGVATGKAAGSAYIQYAAKGCGTFRTTNKRLLTVKAATTATITQSACDSYSWHGTTYTTSGTYTFDSLNVAGCDSLTTLNLTVTASATPSVSISPTSTSNSSQTFTATASGTGGGTVFYTFAKGIASQQASVANTWNATGLANGDIISCAISVTGGACLTTTTAVSNQASVCVSGITPALAILPTTATSSSVTFTANVINSGGGVVTYNFTKNGISQQSSTSNVWNATGLATGDVISCDITITGGSCLTQTTANSTNSVTACVNPAPVSVSIAADNNPVCDGVAVTFTATPSNASSPSYTWFKGLTQVATGVSYNSTFSNGDAITCVMTANNDCGTANNFNSNIVTMVVNPIPNAGAISGASSVCSNGGITLTSNGDAGGSWSSDNAAATVNSSGGVNGASAGSATITYAVSNSCGISKATKSIIVVQATTITVHPPSVGAVCSGSGILEPLTAIGENLSYQWQSLTVGGSGYTDISDGGIYAGTQTATLTISNVSNSDSGTKHRCVVTGSCGSANSLGKTLLVKPNHTITASAGTGGSISNDGVTSVCDGNDAPSYTVTANSGYSIADVQVDGSSVGVVSTRNFFGVTADHTISATFSLNCVATTSSTTQSACVSYTWDGTTYTTSGDYTKHYTNSCGMDSAATLHLTISAAPVNQSVVLSDCKSVSYNGVTYTKNATIYDTIKNGNGCDSVYKTINIYITFQAIISVDKNPTCNTQIATFTSKVYNANLLVYQWYKNGVAIVGATTASYTTAGTIAGDDIQLRVRSKSPLCSSNVNDTVWSNVIHFAGMSSAASKLTISTPTTSVCTGASVTYTATATNAGSMAVYTWKVNGATVAQGKDTFYTSTTIANGDVVSCTLNTNNVCQVTNVINSNTITMTVNATTSVPVNAITGNTGICSIGGTTTLTETTVGGAWNSSDTKVATVNASGVVTATGTGTATIKYTVGTGVCGTNASVDVAVAPIKMLPITGPTTVCQGNSVQLANATVGKGVWSVVNARGTITPGGLLKGTAAGGNAIVQFAVINSAGCSSKAYLNVAVTAPCAPREIPIASETNAPITKLSIYPNPSRGVVTVLINNYELKINNITQLTITDMAGKVLKAQTVTEKQTKVNINGLKPGMYLVTMQSAEGKTTEKLIVE